MTHNDRSGTLFSPLTGVPVRDEELSNPDTSLPPRTDATMTTPASTDVERSPSDKVASKVEEKVPDLQQKVSGVTETVGEKASQVADQVKEKAGDLTGEAHTMSDKGIDSAAAGLGQAASMLRQQGEAHEGNVGNAATKTADSLDSASAYLQEKDTDQMVADLEALVRRRPVESVLVAAGLGFVLSKVFG